MRKSNRETRTPAIVDNWVSRRLSLQRLRALNEDNTDRKLKLVSVLTEMERSAKHLAWLNGISCVYVYIYLWLNRRSKQSRSNHRPTVLMQRTGKEHKTKAVTHVACKLSGWKLLLHILCSSNTQTFDLPKTGPFAVFEYTPHIPAPFLYGHFCKLCMDVSPRKDLFCGPNLPQIHSPLPTISCNPAYLPAQRLNAHHPFHALQAATVSKQKPKHQIYGPAMVLGSYSSYRTKQ